MNKNTVSIDIDDFVWVRLTDEGRRVLREQHDALERAVPSWVPNEYIAPTEDADGWSRWPLWELMHKLGVLVHGLQLNVSNRRLPFEPTIRLEPPT